MFESKDEDILIYLISILVLESSEGKHVSRPSHTVKLPKAFFAVSPKFSHFRKMNSKSLKPSNSSKSITMSPFLSAVFTKDCRITLQILTVVQCCSSNLTWGLYPEPE